MRWATSKRPSFRNRNVLPRALARWLIVRNYKLKVDETHTGLEYGEDSASTWPVSSYDRIGLAGGLIANHLSVLGFPHAALVDEQVGVADHLGEG